MIITLIREWTFLWAPLHSCRWRNCYQPSDVPGPVLGPSTTDLHGGLSFREVRAEKRQQVEMILLSKASKMHLGESPNRQLDRESRARRSWGSGIDVGNKISLFSFCPSQLEWQQVPHASHWTSHSWPGKRGGSHLNLPDNLFHTFYC